MCQCDAELTQAFRKQKINVVPEGEDENGLPIKELVSGRRAVLYDEHSLDGKMTMFNMTGFDLLDRLAELEEKSGVNFDDIDPADSKVAKRLMDPVDGLMQILNCSEDEEQQLIMEMPIKDIKDLTKVLSLMWGTMVWDDNQRWLVKEGIISPKDVIATRDHCFEYLRDKGVEREEALRITDRIRVGRGVSDEDKAILGDAEVPDWFCGFADKVKYMFPLAHSIIYAQRFWELAYFMEYYPDEYEAVRNKEYK